MKNITLICLSLILFFLPLSGQDLSELYEKVLPSVVKILTAEQVPSQAGPAYSTTERGIGSGVLVDAEGLILTAAHVVQTAEYIKVQFPDGEEIPAKVISSVPTADVALIKLNWLSKDKDRYIAKVGDSDQVKIGNRIMMIGSPYGLNFSLSVGYVSGRHINKTFTNGAKWIEYFQTDASINKGNSGGPMFNLDGEVVGIASYILSESGGFEGLGFAATSNVCKTLLLEGKSPWTGVEAVIISGELAEILNLPQSAGLMIQKVASLSPADLLGLRGGHLDIVINGEKKKLGGDIVLAINGITIEDDESLEKISLSMQKEKEIYLKVLRAGEIIRLTGSLKD